MKKILIIIGLILLNLSNVYATRKSPNSPYVISDKLGSFYARCIPYKDSGNEGVTKIYKVEKEEDVLIDTYNWYNKERLLLGRSSTGEIAIMRLGQDLENTRETELDKRIEFSFYINGRFLKSYSTKDIVELGGDREQEKKTLIKITGYDLRADYEVLGTECGWLNYNDCFSIIKFPNGKKMRFDIRTGEVYAKPLPVRYEHPSDKDGKKIGEHKWWDENDNL